MVSVLFATCCDLWAFFLDRRKFEKKVKDIVRRDVEATRNKGTEPVFFIDEDVYNLYFDDMKENIEDSSLSHFLLKYDLGMHTADLVKYFNPDSSRERNFAHLRHLSPKYGFHLCFMALREAAKKHEENYELVEKMKATGMSEWLWSRS